MNDIIFKGPKCKLKGKFYQADNPSNPIVIILYPKSKTDEIPESIQSVIKLLMDMNLSIFLYNFQKLDEITSESIKNINNTHTSNQQDGEDKLFEVISILTWISKKFMEGKILWLFSFFNSAWTGLQVVMRRPEITNYILLSPPSKMKDSGFLIPCSASGVLIHETNINPNMEDVVEKINSKSEHTIEVIPFDNMDIEKNINISPMLDMLREYINKKLEEDTGKIKKIKRDRRRRKKKKMLTEDEKIEHICPIKTLDFD